MRSGSYDLHCHSTLSDGKKTPYELINLAKEGSLKGLSITDHDTLSCYCKDLFAYAEKREIELITGVEFSSFDKLGRKETPIHILGYDIDINNYEILEFCKMHQSRREKRFYKIIEKLEEAGYNIDKSLLKMEEKSSMGRPHIANALIKMGYAQNMNEAFKFFLSESAPYYVRSDLPTIAQTIAIIKKAKGKAVLAHPILIKSREILNKILKEHDFDGLECYYGNFHRSKIQYLLDIAKRKNLSITGGSDFHGIGRDYIYLGVSFISESLVKELLST